MERTILVAEDSATQAQHLKLLLEGAGYRVNLVATGRQGFEHVQVAPPDLIISDVVMPEMDGYAFCEAVKASERTRRIPFVLLTERNTPADIIRGFEQGADNFITKPFEDDYLLERVGRIFENLELRRQGRLDIEITLNVGGRPVIFNTDKQQMIELLFATLEELVRVNGRLAEAQRAAEEHARDLEGKVQERTQQLLQAEKVATMGQLLAGVAHELNNPLSVIVGHAALLRAGTQPEIVPQRATKLAAAADRCARIVRNFLALARQRPPEPQEVRLNELVREAVELLAYPLRVDNVETTLDLAEGLPALWAEPDQLHQVVVNLVTNAYQAMRETAPPRRLTIRTRPERDRVRLEVADTGPGVPPEIQGRIFEPFFTTKPLGQGTGLGLSLCQGFVESHGGSIAVESEPGRGARFLVDLPVATARRDEREAEVGRARVVVTDLVILVVDDEPQVLEVLAELLSADGHRVDTASDGAAALEKLGERSYDLVLTDLRMPRLDGPGLYRAIERDHPYLTKRVIVLTGDTLSPESEEFLSATRVPTVTKPFSAEDVRRAVQGVAREAGKISRV